MFLIQYGLRN